MDLVASPAQCGRDNRNVNAYIKLLYAEAIDLMTATANEIGKKKFGYMRSPELILRGQTVLLYRKIHYSKKGNAASSEALKSERKNTGWI